jgi:hypothetical protein
MILLIMYHNSGTSRNKNVNELFKWIDYSLTSAFSIPPKAWLLGENVYAENRYSVPSLVCAPSKGQIKRRARYRSKETAEYYFM